MCVCVCMSLRMWASVLFWLTKRTCFRASVFSGPWKQHLDRGRGRTRPPALCVMGSSSVGRRPWKKQLRPRSRQKAEASHLPHEDDFECLPPEATGEERRKNCDLMEAKIRRVPDAIVTLYQIGRGVQWYNVFADWQMNKRSLQCQPLIVRQLDDDRLVTCQLEIVSYRWPRPPTRMRCFAPDCGRLSIMFCNLCYSAICGYHWFICRRCGVDVCGLHYYNHYCDISD